MYALFAFLDIFKGGGPGVRCPVALDRFNDIWMDGVFMLVWSINWSRSKESCSKNEDLETFGLILWKWDWSRWD